MAFWSIGLGLGLGLGLRKQLRVCLSIYPTQQLVEIMVVYLLLQYSTVQYSTTGYSILNNINVSYTLVGKVVAWGTGNGGQARPLYFLIRSTLKSRVALRPFGFCVRSASIKSESTTCPAHSDAKRATIYLRDMVIAKVKKW